MSKLDQPKKGKTTKKILISEQLIFGGFGFNTISPGENSTKISLRIAHSTNVTTHFPTIRSTFSPNNPNCLKRDTTKNSDKRLKTQVSPVLVKFT